jgi:hypothetical protein
VPPPHEKDKLIDYLAERLTIAEDAIKEACDCIDKERMRRKTLEQELKTKN